MAEQIKFTDEEVQSINSIREGVNEVFSQLGQVKIERDKKLKELENLENKLIERYGELTKQEQELFNTLNEKYGDGNYDPQTGIFTPVKSEKTDNN